MPITLNGQNYYRTAETCQVVGISKTTLFRWLKENVFNEAEHRDRRGWRLFTENEVEGLKTEVNRIIKNGHREGSNIDSHFSCDKIKNFRDNESSY